NYPTVDAAINVLNINGISGPVTFNISPGTYTIHKAELLAHDISYAITFQSALLDSSSVRITGNDTTFGSAFYSNGQQTASLIFRELTIKDSVGYVFDNIVNLQIESCVLSGKDTAIYNFFHGGT